MSEKYPDDDDNSELPTICQSCEARHGGICAALSGTQLKELNKYSKQSSVPKDTVLRRDEENTETYSNILAGVVKLITLLPDGRQQIVGLQFAPDFLGRPYLSQSDIIAEAATDTKLCSFPKSVLERFIEDVPEMNHLLHVQHIRELDQAREWMLTLGRKTAAEKVASFLLLVATNIDPEREEDDHIEFQIPLKRADIADFLGLSIETVSRQLTKLREQGIINIVKGRMIDVPSISRLQTIAESAKD